MRRHGYLILLLPILCSSPYAFSQASLDQERAGNFRTREERREAGFGTEVTNWLTFSGLIEAENIQETLRLSGDQRDIVDFETDPAIQAALDFNFFDIIESELILEYSEDSLDPIVDEFIIAADIGELGISAGRFYAPFGLYYSHFINGPMLEFAETRADMFLLDYDIADTIELSAFTFKGVTREVGETSNDRGWGYNVDALLLDGRLNLGFGYLSNLAESDERFLIEEQDTFQQKVGAWNSYMVYEADVWDLSLEYLSATENFSEFESDRDRPSSWNLEAAYFPGNNYELAFRYERSREFDEAPQEQYGVSFTWRFPGNISLSAEYLKSNYKPGFFEEDDDLFVQEGDTLAFWFAFEF